MPQMLAKAEQVNQFQVALNKWEKSIAQALPRQMDGARYMRILITEFTKNPDLFKTTKESQFAAILTAAQLGLEPGPLGEAFLIPYYNKKLGVYICTFQPGYQGLVKLAFMSGKVLDIWTNTIYKGDPYEYKDGSERSITHEPQKGPHRVDDIVACYAVIKYVGGVTHCEFMYRDRLDEIKDKSANVNSPMWTNWRREAYEKTVLKRALKFAPKSTTLLKTVVAIDDQADVGVQNLEKDLPQIREAAKQSHILAQVRRKDGTVESVYCTCGKEFTDEDEANYHADRPGAR